MVAILNYAPIISFILIMSEQDIQIGDDHIYQQPGAPLMHTTPINTRSDEEELILLLEESRLSEDRKRKTELIQDRINKKRKYQQEYQENHKLLLDHELNLSPHILDINLCKYIYQEKN